MKFSLTHTLAKVIFTLSLLNTPAAFAAETDNQINKTEIEHSDEELIGFLKIGYGYKHEVSPYFEEVEKLSLYVNGRYQWHGFFVEAYYGTNERQEGLTVGYNFYNTKQWNFDVVNIQAHDGVNIEIYDTDKTLIKNLDHTEMLALRATGNFGQTTLQLLAAPYSFNDDNDEAFYASAWLGRTWYLKNWELNGSIGIKYSSEELLDYYYEISDVEATEHFQAYNPSSGIDVTGQFIVSYPIAENWLFESYFRYTNYSSSINDNPVMQFASKASGRDEDTTEMGLLVSYVF